MPVEILNLAHPFIKISNFFPISVSVQYGNALAICGMNGCGKTTFLRILLGEILPSYGEISVSEKLTYLGVKNGLKPQLKVGLQLPYFTSSYQEFPYGEFLKRRYDDLSKGQQRLIALWIALHGSKSLVLLDEPFLHLDSQNFSVVSEWVINQLKRGKIIILTHHSPVELQKVSPLQILDLNIN